MMTKVAFLGLGVMGYPMAGHLKNKGGHEVTVYNRTAAKAEQWLKEFGGRAAATPKDAAAGQDFVMMCAVYADAKKRGFDFVDAPVSGGQAGAQNGVLTVMCGGEPEPYGRAEKVIAAYARMCRLIGGPGAGQLTKMVNQICIAGLVEGLAEAIH